MKNSLGNFFFLFFFLISTSLLIFTYYKSEILWEGFNREHYVPYYILFLLISICSIISLFLIKKIKEYIIIISFSLVISIYLIEFYLAIKQSQIASNELIIKKDIKRAELFEKKTGKKFDYRNIDQVYLDLKKKNKKITTVVFPYLNPLKNKFEIFPLGGISNSQTIFCNEGGFYSIYESDRFGFNNPDDQWDNKNIEYFLVGDSFTHGACIDRPYDIASVLRELSNKNVLNLGYASNGPMMEYAVLREYLRPNVKNVLWIYYENDLTDLQNEISNHFLKAYIKDLNFSQKLMQKQTEIDELIQNTLNNEIKSRNTVKEKKIKNDFYEFIKISKVRKLLIPVSQKNNLKKTLKLAKDLTNINNSNFYLVYLPEYNHIKKKFTNKNYKSIKKIVAELNIPMIDIYEEIFQKQKDPLIFFPLGLEGHYNELGYKKIAETIYNSLKEYKKIIN